MRGMLRTSKEASKASSALTEAFTKQSHEQAKLPTSIFQTQQSKSSKSQASWEKKER